MPRFGLWLTVLFALSACSSHNPFENTRSDFRIDGYYVDYKTTQLPGTYTAELGADFSYISISEEDEIEILLPTGSSDCQVRARGKLASVREIQSPVKLPDNTYEFRFGTFKIQVNPDITHVLVAMIDEDEDSDPPTVAIEWLYKGGLVFKTPRQYRWDQEPQEESLDKSPEQQCLNPELAKYYDQNRRLFFIPVQWTDSDLIFGDIVWRKE